MYYYGQNMYKLRTKIYTIYTGVNALLKRVSYTQYLVSICTSGRLGYVI